jgi:hypothetical protein
MKMKTMRSSIVCLVGLLLAAPALRAQAQDFSKYRAFSLGTKLTTALKHTDRKSADEGGSWAARVASGTHLVAAEKRKLPLTEAVKLEQPESPQREADYQKIKPATSK